MTIVTYSDELESIRAQLTAARELAQLVIDNCDHAETVQAAIALLRITE